MAETQATPSNESCAAAVCRCDCPARLAKLEKTVHRIRLWLFISLGFLILLIGIGIGKDEARKMVMHQMQAGQQGPMPQQGPGPQPGPGPMGQPGPQGRPMQDQGPRRGR
ncbi:MAG: hypothetical protein ACKOTD_02910 [Phycisphaerales bacterium]